MPAERTLQDYLQDWNLAQPTLLAQTGTSALYTVLHQQDTCILKLLVPGEIEEQRGAVALQYFGGRGAVRLLRHDDGAQLLEYASGEELISLVEAGDDASATRIIASVIRQLHQSTGEISGSGLMPLDRWFRALFERAALDHQAGTSSVFTKAARVAERLLTEPRDVRVLHGDIHHRNIRQSPRGWLAFDPKGLVGERTYDCANTLCNPPIPKLVHNEARLLAQSAILADELELEPARVLAFTYAYTCLNASWWLRLGNADIVNWSLAVARILDPHVPTA